MEENKTLKFRGGIANSGSSERGFRYKLNIDSGSI